MLVGVPDDGDPDGGGLLLTAPGGGTGRRRHWRGVVELHQQLEQVSLKLLLMEKGSIHTFANILSSSSRDSRGVLSKSPSDSWSLVGGVGGGWRPAISSAALLFFMNIFLQMRLSFSPTEARNVDRLVSCHCITLASLTHGPRYQGMLLYSLSIRADMRRILTLNMPPTTGWARVRSRVWSLEQDF